MFLPPFLDFEVDIKNKQYMNVSYDFENKGFNKVIVSKWFGNRFINLLHTLSWFNIFTLPPFSRKICHMSIDQQIGMKLTKELLHGPIICTNNKELLSISIYGKKTEDSINI